MSNTDRIVALSEALAAAQIARDMAEEAVWAKAFETYEQELLERLLACEPGDDLSRYRLAEAIKAGRRARRVIEHQGRTTASLERELALLEGRKLAPIA